MDQTTELAYLQKIGRWFETRSALMIAIGVNGLAFVSHLFILSKYAINLPYFDEWEIAGSRELGEPLNLSWLMGPHNQHRIPLTKCLVWVYYRINHWNLFTNQIVNFFVYGLLAVTLMMVLRTGTEKKRLALVTVAILPVFSLTNFENHIFAFDIHFHLFIMFFLLATYLRYMYPAKGLAVLASTLLGILSILSFSGGIFCCLALLCGDIVFSNFKRSNLVIFSDVLIGGSVALWFLFYPHAPSGVHLILPWQPTFWLFLFKLIGGGLGIIYLPRVIGAVFFSLIPLLIFKTVWRKKLSLIKPGTKILLVSLAGLVLTCFANVVGRASSGLESAMSSRYAESILVMFPLLYALAAQTEGERARSSRKILLVIAMLGVPLGLSTVGYQHINERKTAGLSCVKAYYAKKNEGMCPTIFPEDLATKLDVAKELNISFISNF